MREKNRKTGSGPVNHLVLVIFNKWWKKACSNLGVIGIYLYGGTRHSTAIALREFASPEEIRRASMHSTNKAFERYFRIENEEVKNIYRYARKGGVEIVVNHDKQN